MPTVELTARGYLVADDGSHGLARFGAILQPVVCTTCALFWRGKEGQQVGLYDPEMPHHIYFWRVQDRNGRWYKTRFRTTEEHIRKEHPEAERIDSDSIDVQRVDMYKPTPAHQRAGDK